MKVKSKEALLEDIFVFVEFFRLDMIATKKNQMFTSEFMRLTKILR